MLDIRAHVSLGRINLWLTRLALSLVLTVGASGNVIHDYEDAADGTDTLNSQREGPFAGGSRFIENGILSRTATAILGYCAIRQGVDGLFTNFARLVTTMNAARATPNFERKLASLARILLLVIDDFGAAFVVGRLAETETLS